MTDEGDKPGDKPPKPRPRVRPSAVPPPREGDAAVPAPTPSVDTSPTAGERQPGAPTVEVSREAFEAPPPMDPPSGEMRPLDPTLQPPDVRTFEAAAHPGEAPPYPGEAPYPGEPGGPTAFPAIAGQPGDPTAVDYVPAPVPFDAPTQPTGPARSDESILPPTYDANALRDAVGAPAPRPKRKRSEPVGNDGLPKPAGRRPLVIAVLAIIVGLTIAAFVFLGRANSSRLLVACSTTQVTAEQGRGFPPWGSHPLAGPEWKPIGLPPNAECKERETEQRSVLEGWYLDLLMDRASTTLTARDPLEGVQAGKPNPLDLAADQLNQALLLSRSPDRRDQRKEVQRLLGDVQYWRASLRLRDASAALADASRQFDAAAAQLPRHVTNAAEWATFLRRLVDDLQAGPKGVPAAAGAVGPQPSTEAPTVPVGTAQPVEEGSATAPPPATPDAGIPTGGVLL